MDDILLYHRINTTDDCILLQNDINELIKLSKDWQLLFNFNKSKFLGTYNMDSKMIKQISSAKYLGITVNKLVYLVRTYLKESKFCLGLFYVEI